MEVVAAEAPRRGRPPAVCGACGLPPTGGAVELRACPDCMTRTCGPCFPRGDARCRDCAEPYEPIGIGRADRPPIDASTLFRPAEPDPAEVAPPSPHLERIKAARERVRTAAKMRLRFIARQRMCGRCGERGHNARSCGA